MGDIVALAVDNTHEQEDYVGQVVEMLGSVIDEIKRGEIKPTQAYLILVTDTPDGLADYSRRSVMDSSADAIAVLRVAEALEVRDIIGG